MTLASCEQGRGVGGSLQLQVARRRYLRQRVHDHGAGHRCGWPGEKGRKALLDPGERAPV